MALMQKEKAAHSGLRQMFCSSRWGLTPGLNAAAGDRRHKKHFVSFLEGIVVPSEEADVFFIDVDVQEASNLSGFVPQVRFEFGELFIEF